MRPQLLGAELIKMGVHVSYIVEDYPENVRADLVHEKATVVFVPRSRGMESIRARRRAVGKLNPDFMHILNPSAKAFFSLIFTPSVKVIGDWEEWQAFNSTNFSAGKLFLEKILDAWLRRRSYLRCVVSQYLKMEFKKMGYDSVYVPYAQYLDPVPEDGSSPFQEPAAVYMGSFQPRYDQDVVFDALLLLKKRGFEANVFFIGGGRDLEMWRNFVEVNQLANVKIMGRLDWEELWPYMRHAHVLLFPIRSNLLNLARCPAKTLAYAQASRPIVTCDVGEVSTFLGQEAKYIESKPEAFADEIQYSLTTKKEEDVLYPLKDHTWKHRAEVILAALMVSHHSEK
ncbi:MAG: glycosyltransferase involved in cell wall biosynthesis [Halieaceae bacterium]|jgi:glycosyltransferase involved in cell wall biosynthesis